MTDAQELLNRMLDEAGSIRTSRTSAHLLREAAKELERLLEIEATLAVIRELAQRPSERSSGEPPEKILGRIWSQANRALSIPEAGR